VLTALLSGIAGTTWQAVRATRAERTSRAAFSEAQTQRQLAESRQQEAEAAVQFLTGNVLQGATPERLPDKAVRDSIVRVMLDPAAAAIGSAFADRPLVEASVRETLARCYLTLGRADLGASHASIALDLRTKSLGAENPETLEAMITLAALLASQGKFPDAQQLLSDASQRASSTLGEDHPITLDACVHTGDLLINQGRFAEAEPVLRDALEREKRTRNRPDTVSTVIQNLTRAQLLTGRAAESEALLREAYDRVRRDFAADDPRRLAVTNSLAQCLEALGRYGEAKPLFVEAVASARAILGNDHKTTLILLNNLGSLLKRMRDLPEAERCYREVVDSMRRLLGNEHPSTLTAINNLGTLLMDQRKLDAAEPMMREAWEGRRRALSDTHPETVQTLYGLANIISARGRKAEAEPLYAQLYQRCQNSELPPRQAATFMAEWGPALVTLERYADAEAPLRDALRRLTETGQQVSPQMARVLAGLAEVCEHTGRPDEAAEWRGRRDALLASTRPASNPSTNRAAR
jgi:tetratricopeptide (TPR) repeat protein